MITNLFAVTCDDCELSTLEVSGGSENEREAEEDALAADWTRETEGARVYHFCPDCSEGKS
jgi:hypothetical protein